MILLRPFRFPYRPFLFGQLAVAKHDKCLKMDERWKERREQKKKKKSEFNITWHRISTYYWPITNVSPNLGLRPLQLNNRDDDLEKLNWRKILRVREGTKSCYDKSFRIVRCLSHNPRIIFRFGANRCRSISQSLARGYDSGSMPRINANSKASFDPSPPEIQALILLFWMEHRQLFIDWKPTLLRQRTTIWYPWAGRQLCSFYFTPMPGETWRWCLRNGQKLWVHVGI